MKKLINLTMIAMACLAVACHKNGVLTTLGTVKFTGPLTVAPSNPAIYITGTTDTTATLVTFTWPAVKYPDPKTVTYTLIADLPADTLGTAPWGNGVLILVGNDVLTKTYKSNALGALAVQLGIAPNDTGKIVFRVQAFQDRNVFSNAVTVTVSPYAAPVAASNGYPVLYVPGDYQTPATWDPAAALTVAAPPASVYPLANSSTIYEGFIYVASTTGANFKFTSEADFNGINYGDSGTPNLLSTDGGAGNLTTPATAAGTLYELSANTVTLAWSATPVTWGIIGDATPGGWTTDTQMTLDPTTMTESVTLPMITAGSFKFRENDQWTADFGLDANGQIYFADNPIFGGGGARPGLNNMTVPANGTYKITLYLNPNDYHYTAVKQ